MPLDLSKLIELAVALGVKLLYCIAIVIICSIAIKVLQKLVKRIFNGRLANNKYMTERKTTTVMTLINSVIKYLVYFVGAVSILTKFGVEVASIIAVAGVGAVAIGLAAQSLVEDFISGFFILLEDQFAVGDLVTIQDKTGTVEAINIKSTRLRAANGTVYIIPNGQIKLVTNMSQDYMNAIVDVGIDYREDMPRVLELLNDEMDRFANTASGLRKPPTVLGIIALDDSAVTVRILAECMPGEQFHIERDIRLAVKQRLDKEGVSIPFPQRTVHLVKEEG